MKSLTSSPLALFANALWFLSCLPESMAFHLARRNVSGTQEKLLLRLLRRNAKTDFGRRYDFASIRTAAEYQQRVPLSIYDDYRRDIEAIGAGQPRILTQEPPLLLEPTSGSTAATKYIPYTAALKTEFQRAIAPWIVDLFGHMPELFLGQAYWSVTPVTQRNARTPGGIPIGFEEDSEYLSGWQRHLLRAVLAVPPLVRLIDDMETFRYVTLLFLLRSRSLALISVWNPTFLTLLLNRLPDWWPLLTADIAAGTLTSPGPLAPDLKQQLISLNRPNPRRAEEIETIFREEHDPAIIHTRLWPHLRLVSCWTEAQAALHVPELERLLPQAHLQGKGLIATEGFVSLPLLNHPSAALAIHSHFFEFLPVHDSRFTIQSQRLPDGNSPLLPPLLAHQLQPNRQYSVVITTGGGLYRYQLHDLVEVTGYWGTCPLLRFMSKESYISDWFGEKLNERHVGESLDRICRHHAVQPVFTLVAYETTASAYTLFIEAPTTSDATLKQIGQALELALQENYHYRYCRQLGQLGSLQLFRIENGGPAAYLSFCQVHGQRAGDIKPLALHRLSGWTEIFQGQMISVEANC